MLNVLIHGWERDEEIGCIRSSTVGAHTLAHSLSMRLVVYSDMFSRARACWFSLAYPEDIKIVSEIDTLRTREGSR